MRFLDSKARASSSLSIMAVIPVSLAGISLSLLFAGENAVLARFGANNPELEARGFVAAPGTPEPLTRRFPAGLFTPAFGSVVRGDACGFRDCNIGMKVFKRVLFFFTTKCGCPATGGLTPCCSSTEVLR